MARKVGGWLVLAAAVGAGATLLARRRRESPPVRRNGGYRTLRAVTVDRSPESILQACRDPERLPTMLDCPVAIEERHGGRHLTLRDPGGAAGWTVEVEAESGTGPFTWRITEGPTAHEGRLELASAPGGRGTELRVELRYPDSRLGHRVAVLRGSDPDQVLRTLLRRAKSVIEAGEVVSTMSEPSGREGVAERTTRAVREKLSTGGRP
ncbi:cyclase [Plantactinospora sp. WMMB782]|uniref:cyclase n=1 Tax=Plantactinospora sp. WMMB782 TaxID=3404121 RepID=UPI003B926A64